MWKSFSYIFSHSDRVRFALLILLMLLGSVMELASLGAVPLYVSVVIGSKELSELPLIGEWLNGVCRGDTSRIAIVGGVVLGGLFLVRTLYMMFTVWAQSRILGNRWLATSGRFFEAYLYSPYAELRKRNSSNIIENVVVETERLVAHVLDSFISFVRNGVICLTVIGILLVFAPVVSLCAVFALACIGGILLIVVNRRIKTWGLEEYEARNLVTRSIAEGIGVCREASIVGKREFFASRLHEAMEKQTVFWRKMKFLQKSLWPLMEFVTVGVLLGTFAFILLIGGNIDSAASTLVLLTVCLARLKGCFTELMFYYSILRNNSATVNVIAAELRALETEKMSDGVSSGKVSGDIEIRKVSFRYPDGESAVLDSVDMQISQGSSVAFVGKTGSGKSTLADMMLGLLVPDSGEITVGGKNIAENIRGWRDEVGFVPQDIFLLDDTIRANVALGEKDVDDAALERALKSADILDFVKSLPDGDRTVIGERGVRLSGGQRQRLGIARALYRNPPVLIFDEATSALDNVTENAVVDAVGRLRGDHTLIIIAHRLSTIRECSSIFYFEDGHVLHFDGLDALKDARPDFVR